MRLSTRFVVLYGLLLVSQSTLAADFDFSLGADAEVKGFSKQKNVNGPQNKDQGLAQLLRARLDFTHKDGFALKTRTILSGDRWDGDTPSGNTNVTGTTDNGGGGSDIRLDYGHLEYKKEDWTFSAGRQTANWAHCLTTCDDRRDRLLVMKNIEGLYAAFVYDKRTEGTIDRDTDDGDMYALLLLKFGQSYEVGFLGAYWVNADGTYVLGGAWNFSPYVKFYWGDYQLNVLTNWIGWGDDTSWFSGQHHVYAVSLAKKFGDKFKLEGQALVTMNGGYLSTGYDTYLSMVNNNPDHHQSQIQAARIGGFGTFTGGKEQDESLYSARATYGFNSDWSLSLAYGFFELYEKGRADNVSLHAADAVVKYQLTKNAHLKASYGRIFGDYQLNVGAVTLATSF